MPGRTDFALCGPEPCAQACSADTCAQACSRGPARPSRPPSLVPSMPSCTDCLTTRMARRTCAAACSLLLPTGCRSPDDPGEDAILHGFVEHAPAHGSGPRRPKSVRRGMLEHEGGVEEAVMTAARRKPPSGRAPSWENCGPLHRRGGRHEQEGRRANRGRAGTSRGGGLMPCSGDAGGPRRAHAARQAAPDHGRGPHHIPGPRDLRALGPLALAQAPAVRPRHHPRARRASPRLGFLRPLRRARPGHLRLLGIASKDACGLRLARRQEARRAHRPTPDRPGRRRGGVRPSPSRTPCSG